MLLPFYSCPLVRSCIFFGPFLKRNRLKGGIIISQTRQAAQQKSSHCPFLLKKVVLLSIGTLSTSHPAIPVLAIA
jgi:hypothetical protein